MKKMVMIFTFILMASLAHAYSGGPPDQKTSAPGEGSCTDCHSSFPINSGDGSFAIDAPAGYTPGDTYTITVTLSDNGQSRWGFELTPLDQGTVTITDAANTQQSSAGGNTYVKQTSTGTYNGSSDGPVTWQFDWTAPTTDPPESITLYANGNATDASFGTSGDYVYSTSVTLGRLTAIDDFGDGALPSLLSMESYPNPFNAVTTINYNLPSDGKVNVSIYDIRGRLITELEDSYKSAGAYSVTWAGRDRNGGNVVSGIYFVRLAVDANSTTNKLVLLK